MQIIRTDRADASAKAPPSCCRPTRPRKGLVVVEPGSGVQALGAVDVVFPVLHGRFGEDGTIQGLLEMAGIPYVGPGVFASAAAMDKEFTKKLLAAEGLEVGSYAVVRRGDDVSSIDLAHLGLPAFVKPARAGSSVGITKMTDWADLPDALAPRSSTTRRCWSRPAVSGREIECGVLESADGSPEASVPAEIRLVGAHDWYDFEAKYLDDACEFDVPAQAAGRGHRAAAASRLPGVRRARLRRPGPGRLLRHAGRAGDRQRGQHDARASRRSRCSRGCGRRPVSSTPSWSTG